MRTGNQDAPDINASALEGLASRLAQAIAQTGLNQSEFSRQLGVSAGFVSDVVRGQKKPGAEFLYAVKMTFGFSVDWLLTGEGTLNGGIGIDLELLRTIRLQIAIARSAIMDADPTAKALLLLIRDGRLNDIEGDPVLTTFLDQLSSSDSEMELAAELYNGHIWSSGSPAQQRNLLAATIAHFETRKPLNKMAALGRASGSNVQINVGTSQRNAGRDYYEK